MWAHSSASSPVACWEIPPFLQFRLQSDFLTDARRNANWWRWATTGADGVRFLRQMKWDTRRFPQPPPSSPSSHAVTWQVELCCGLQPRARRRRFFHSSVTTVRIRRSSQLLMKIALFILLKTEHCRASAHLAASKSEPTWQLNYVFPGVPSAWPPGLFLGQLGHGKVDEKKVTDLSEIIRY